MVQLKLVQNGTLIGAINWYAIHATSMNSSNCYISSDNLGYASILLENDLNQRTTIPLAKVPFHLKLTYFDDQFLEEIRWSFCKLQSRRRLPKHKRPLLPHHWPKMWSCDQLMYRKQKKNRILRFEWTRWRYVWEYQDNCREIIWTSKGIFKKKKQNWIIFLAF